MKSYCLETAIGRLRATRTSEGMVLTPFEDIDISTTKGGLAFLKTAHVCIPLEWERSMEHIGYAEYAATVGTEMLRDMSKPKPIYFRARFTHPSMELKEPDGYCFLFRLEDQSELFLIISDSAILTAPEPPFEIIAGKSKEETEKALADFRARNREELDPRRALATAGEAVPVYMRKDYPLIRGASWRRRYAPDLGRVARKFRSIADRASEEERGFAATTCASDPTYSKHGWTPIRFRCQSIQGSATPRICMMMG